MRTVDAVDAIATRHVLHAERRGDGFTCVVHIFCCCCMLRLGLS